MVSFELALVQLVPRILLYTYPWLSNLTCNRNANAADFMVNGLVLIKRQHLGRVQKAIFCASDFILTIATLDSVPNSEVPHCATVINSHRQSDAFLAGTASREVTRATVLVQFQLCIFP